MVSHFKQKTMQDRTFHTLLFLYIAAIGCYATIAQVILIREFLNIFYSNELCLGIVFGAWFFGIATGAFAGAKIERILKQAFSVFVIALFIMCLVLPVQIFSARILVAAVLRHELLELCTVRRLESFAKHKR